MPFPLRTPPQRGKAVHPSLLPLLPSPALSLDLTEISGLDFLAFPDGPIAAAQRRAAQLFSASQTFFLVNGSTAGILAAVLATCRPGDTLILPRNCHLSCFNALVLSGAAPRWLTPVYDKDFEAAQCLTAEGVRRAIEEEREAGRRVGAGKRTSDPCIMEF